MRNVGYIISLATAVALVRQGSAVLTVIGLALLFMAAYNIGWTHAEETERR